MSTNAQINVVIIISANIEWQVLLGFFPQAEIQQSPLGQWFTHQLELPDSVEPVVFFHGGWGKIAAAASAQFVIDRWSPVALLNLGTCGGFAGDIEKGTIVLVDRTVVYDIIEEMTDPDEAAAHFATEIDLSWLAEPYPQPVRRSVLVSADRDLRADDIPWLKAKFGAVAADWESGAVAWVAAKNSVRCLILRGVTDLVGSGGGEAYDGNLHVFVAGTTGVFRRVLPHLPQWVGRIIK
jgi:adenosylhomocysteine nucleosidase